MYLKLLPLIFCLGFPGFPVYSQTEKSVHQHAHFWISTNNIYQFTNRWGLLTDIHIRRTNFVKNPSFYFLRAGVEYRIKRNLKVAGGYAHMWLASSQQQWESYTNENRIYQQLSFTQRYPRMNTLFRVRNEQRVFNSVVQGTARDNHYLINRFRMLLSIGIPFSQGSKTELLLADEIHLNFGENVVFNTFEQNRITVGIKHSLGPQWSFDTGYMMVFQQQASGFEYNLNHTFRLFFYGNLDFRKDKSRELDYIRHAEE